MDIKSRAFKIDVIDFGLRFYTAIMVSIYGIAKPFQFSHKFDKEVLISDLNGAELMWLFFGHSTIIPIIIGVFQVGGSILLLFKKTKFIGIFILVPILGNIIMFDLVYKVHLGATLYACAFLFFLLISSFLDMERLKTIIASLLYLKEKQPIEERLIKFAFGSFIVIFLFILFQILI